MMDPNYLDVPIEEESVWGKFKNNLAELIEFIAIIGAIFVIGRFFVAEPHRVSGSSMVPNFHNDDMIITNKLAGNVFGLQRGEVIILQNPRDPSVVFIKRIIGLPSEKIRISDGQVFINGQVLPEPYLPNDTRTTGETFLIDGEERVIPENQYFAMGDNRGNSSDSREFGPIKKSGIIGQAILRYWPPQKITIIAVNKASL